MPSRGGGRFHLRARAAGAAPAGRSVLVPSQHSNLSSAQSDACHRTVVGRAECQKDSASWFMWRRVLGATRVISRGIMSILEMEDIGSHGKLLAAESPMPSCSSASCTSDHTKSKPMLLQPPKRLADGAGKQGAGHRGCLCVFDR